MLADHTAHPAANPQGRGAHLEQVAVAGNQQPGRAFVERFGRLEETRHRRRRHVLGEVGGESHGFARRWLLLELLPQGGHRPIQRGCGAHADGHPWQQRRQLLQQAGVGHHHLLGSARQTTGFRMLDRLPQRLLQ